MTAMLHARLRSGQAVELRVPEGVEPHTYVDEVIRRPPVASPRWLPIFAEGGRVAWVRADAIDVLEVRDA